MIASNVLKIIFLFVIGCGKIQVATDIELLSKTTALCGGLPCRPELGEICIGEELCGCPPGQKRAGPDEICRQVIAFTFPVWVVRKYQHQLQYNESFANPQDSIYKLFVTSFESGVRQSYAQTPLQNAFVISEVRDISPPSVLNGSWGLLYNATMFFCVGQAPTAETAYNTLNDCHPKGICIATGPNSYRCECAHGYRDMSVANPGHDCVPLYGINECENTTLNECSEHAQCFDFEYLYRCECLRGFKDISPKGAVAGSKCVTDFCAGINFCSANSTGENLEDKCFCHCKPNFVDLRNETTETERIGTGLSTSHYCFLEVDINECLFPGLHNCSEHAECIDLAHGYTCKCSVNYINGNPQMPGRNCTAAAVPTALCGGLPCRPYAPRLAMHELAHCLLVLLSKRTCRLDSVTLEHDKVKNRNGCTYFTCKQHVNGYEMLKLIDIYIAGQMAEQKLYKKRTLGAQDNLIIENLVHGYIHYFVERKRIVIPNPVHPSNVHIELPKPIDKETRKKMNQLIKHHEKKTGKQIECHINQMAKMIPYEPLRHDG